MIRKDQEKASLLFPRNYDDDDAASVDSDRDIRSDEEDAADVRTSTEREDEDREVFANDYEEDEVDADPAGPGVRLKRLLYREKDDSDRVPLTIKERREQRRASRRHRERLKRGEHESELVYGMEEGGQPSQSPSRNSSESDLRRLGDLHSEKTSKRKSTFKRMALHVGIIAFFLALLFGAYSATKSNRAAQAKLALALSLSNGTSLFAPTTILISLDGFRADFLQRGLTPTLNRFIQGGISPLYMLPSFPSVTFPNHYTMATGLYPESHGIVGNTFWDPSMKEEFYYTRPEQSLQPKWWGGEPLWVTAESQGVRSAVHMWPGSEAHILGIEPAHIDKYNGEEDLSRKVDRILQLLDLPGPDSPSALDSSPRPQLIAAYVPNVDADGHLYGPNSTEIRQTIRNVDNMLAGVFRGLQERNLTNIVNVVVVSDHGMATTSVKRLVQLEDLVDVNAIEHIDGWPLYGLRPKLPEDLDRLHRQIKEKTADNPNLEVYLRDKDMPERYHFSKNDRIAPLWIVPKAGWAVVTKEEFDVEKGKKEGLVYHPRGLHGYDHENSLMRAIFVARGPAFPHKPGSRVEVFQNTEVYNIVCDSIGLTPKPNNGTLRLPLRPVGLHSDNDSPNVDIPFDPPADSPKAAPDAVNSVMASASQAAEMTAATPAPTSSTTDSQPSESPSPEPSEKEPPKNPKNKWWQWVNNKWDDAKKKLSDLFGGS